jgi:predicted NUDIX family NTP pyrophosphohydrolase
LRVLCNFSSRGSGTRPDPLPKASAGILLYARDGSAVRVFLAHPGGPFWRHRDEGAWSIPKGGIASGETAQAAALREFQEELGQVPPGKLQPLGRIRQPGGKRLEAFALEGDFDMRNLRSNLFELERPPRSGATRTFPESIGRHGSTLQRRASGCSAVSARCSIALKRC